MYTRPRFKTEANMHWLWVILIGLVIGTNANNVFSSVASSVQ
jgi:hypothetical protein